MCSGFLKRAEETVQLGIDREDLNAEQAHSYRRTDTGLTDIMLTQYVSMFHKNSDILSLT
jgi:hypothetical protein